MAERWYGIALCREPFKTKQLDCLCQCLSLSGSLLLSHPLSLYLILYLYFLILFDICLSFSPLKCCVWLSPCLSFYLSLKTLHVFTLFSSSLTLYLSFLTNPSLIWQVHFSVCPQHLASEILLFAHYRLH